MPQTHGGEIKLAQEALKPIVSPDDFNTAGTPKAYAGGRRRSHFEVVQPDPVGFSVKGEEVVIPPQTPITFFRSPHKQWQNNIRIAMALIQDGRKQVTVYGDNRTLVESTHKAQRGRRRTGSMGSIDPRNA